jgi:hypothetical protein
MSQKSKSKPSNPEPQKPAQPSKRKSPDLPGIQGEGVAQTQVAALEDAIADYIPARDKRLAAGLEEKKNKVLIIALMKKHGLGSYQYDDLVVVIEPKDITDDLKLVAKADYEGHNE